MADDSIDLIIRRENARLLATLVKHLGPHQFALAEDVAQDAMLSAFQSWQKSSVPQHPGAWLRRVAINRAIDVLRKNARLDPLSEGQEPLETLDTPEFHDVDDPELQLLLMACHESLSDEDQIILSLHLVGQFTARDISKLILKPKPTIAQRLVRLKQKLRDDDSLGVLQTTALEDKADAVLRSMYLMFCAGYLPSRGDQLVRRDIVSEVLRLATLVTEHQPKNGAACALLALLLFQTSRMDAREHNGQLIPLQEQDRTLWDESRIELGMHYLQESRQSSLVSRYHIEAAIAAQYATTRDLSRINWPQLAALYEQLEVLTGSPIVGVSSALTLMFSGKLDLAEKKLTALAHDHAVNRYSGYYVALAEVSHRSGDHNAAQAARENAIALQENTIVRAFMDDRLLVNS